MDGTYNVSGSTTEQTSCHTDDKALWQWVDSHHFGFDVSMATALFGIKRPNRCLDDLSEFIFDRRGVPRFQPFIDIPFSDKYLALAHEFQKSEIYPLYRGNSAIGLNVDEIGGNSLYRLIYLHQERSEIQNRFAYWVYLKAHIQLSRYNTRNDNNLNQLLNRLTHRQRKRNWELLSEFFESLAKRTAHTDKLSFEQFSSIIIEETEKRISHKNKSSSSKQLYMLLCKVSRGVYEPELNESNSDKKIAPYLQDRLIANPSLEHRNESALNLMLHPNSYEMADEGDGQPPGLMLLRSAPLLDKQSEFDFQLSSAPNNVSAIFTKVEPNIPKVPERLSLGSVYLQTAESSLYLPWSWNKPNPYEIPELLQWISNTRHSKELATRLGGVITELSILTSRTPAQVLDFEITDLMTDEWSITKDLSHLQRRAPLRHDQWSPKNAQIELIKPTLEKLRVPLPEETSNVFHEAILYFTEESKKHSVEFTNLRLAHLWAYIEQTPISQWFNYQAKKHFPRLTSSKLSVMKGQQAFNNSADPSLARLMAAHPRSGLPASCNYDSWDNKTVYKVGEFQLEQEGNRETVQLLGSLLTPCDEWINSKLGEAWNKLEDIRHQGNLIDYHNALTQYTVIAINAATGTRIVRDPFELKKHFNLSDGILYINDKSDDGLHHGRLIPLPKKLVAIIQIYFEHLDALAKALGTNNSEFAQQIKSVDSASPTIPLFFLLDQNLQWRSMTEANQMKCKLVYWELPENLLRHRFAQSLHIHGVDIEIIQAWMGHAERGVETYGNNSIRCWLEDCSSSLNIFEEVFSRLHFEIPEPTDHPDIDWEHPAISHKSIAQRSFGHRARRQARVQRIKEAVRLARQTIEQFVKEHPLDEMSEDTADTLIKRMLIRDDGLAHHYSGIRLDVLKKVFKRAGSPLIKRIRLTQLDRLESSSMITEGAPLAFSKRDRLEGVILTLRRKKIEDIGFNYRPIVGAILFCLEKRITYKKLLTDLIDGQNYRLIHHHSSYLLEYSEELNPEDWDAPVQRHAVSYKTARLLEKAKGKKNQSTNKFSECIPTCLKPLASILLPHQDIKDVKSSDLLEELCATINQINLIAYPGITAAAMSERRPPTSLPLKDYIRVTEKRFLRPPIEENDEKQVQPDLEIIYQRSIQSAEPIALHTYAKKLLSDVYTILKTYTRSNREVTANRIDKLVRTYEYPVSQTVVMLIYWITFMMRRGKQKRTSNSKYYATESLIEYFGQLKNEFCDLGYGINLLKLNSEELTTFYQNVLDHKVSRNVDLKYPAQRLIEFHNWARDFGIEEPNWEELEVSNDRRSVRPSLVTPAEIRSILTLIGQQSNLSITEKLFQQFALILGSEFGLRREEVLKLTYSNLILVDGEVAGVIVTNNQFRSLKTNNAQRVLPVYSPLPTQYKTVFTRVISRYEALFQDQSNQPLFSILNSAGTVDFQHAENLIDRLITLIQSATGSKHNVFHGLRDSKCNILEALIYPFESTLSRVLSRNKSREELVSCLLGPQHKNSRRTTAAMACFMGHRTIATSLRNYDRLMTDWIDHLRPVPGGKKPLLNSTNTKTWETYEPTINLNSQIIETSEVKLSIVDTLHMSFLIANGYSASRMSDDLGISLELCHELVDLFEQISRQMRFKSRTKSNSWITATDNPRALLQNISAPSWQRMITWFDHHQDTSSANEYVNDDRVEKELVPIQDLPSLFNERRLVHIRRESHGRLIRNVMNLFGLSNSDIQIKTKGQKESLTMMLKQQGFDVSDNLSFGQLEDIEPFAMEIEGFNHNQHEMGLLKLSKQSSGPLRDSLALTVAIIVTGFWEYAVNKQDKTLPKSA